MNKTFLKALFRGKAIGRALLVSSVEKLVQSSDVLLKAEKVLDVGSQSASHERAFPKHWLITKSNYQKHDKEDLIIDVNKKFPLEDASFDGVTIFHTLYLADDYINCIQESVRVSRSFVLFNVPLISSLAPHPVDLNRFTYDRLVLVMKKLGISQYKIIPIGGSFTSALALVEHYLYFRVLRICAGVLAKMLDHLDRLTHRSCPVQYLVLVIK
jgi:hypothetical protein